MFNFFKKKPQPEPEPTPVPQPKMITKLVNVGMAQLAYEDRNRKVHYSLEIKGTLAVQGYYSNPDYICLSRIIEATPPLVGFRHKIEEAQRLGWAEVEGPKYLPYDQIVKISSFFSECFVPYTLSEAVWKSLMTQYPDLEVEEAI